MLRIMAGALAALMISGCGREAGRVEKTNAPAMLISGIDMESMDTRVRPQDDFYRYANGGWLETTEIPAAEVGWGSYMTLNKKSLEQSRALVEEIAESTGGSPEQRQLGDYYRAWMNAARARSLGMQPLIEDMQAIDALATHDQVAAHFGRVNPTGVGGPFNFYVGRDDKDSTRYVAFFLQTGLGLPDRDYYFDESDRGQEIIAGYKMFIDRLLTHAGDEDARNAAQRIFDLETRLAEHQWDKVDNRDADKVYNPYTDEEFSALLSNFNLDAYLAGIGLARQPMVVVMQPSYMAAVNDMFRQVDVETWKDYMKLRLLSSFANFLSDEFVETRFDFYSRVLYGREEQPPRWRRAVSSINGNLGELLGRVYVERHFSPVARERVSVMVDNLIAAYAGSIRELDWMSDETKEQALLKLSKFNPKIGYPSKWKDYSDLVTRPDDLVGNIKRARIWGHNDNITKLGEPIDKEEWFMSPQQVNAYYYASGNEIVFPAAYLQPPNFILEAEDAYNYGAIGSTIGHEIGHGFDDQGSKYDGDGNLKSWWQAEDRARFEVRTRGLVEQYNKFEVLPGLFINGELTLGENIGDLGGTAIALKAYKQSLEGKENPVIDGFTAAERFFLGNAQSSRLKWRDELLEILVKTDPHAPDEFRVNGVFSNMQDFYETYDVKQGHGLFLPEEERVSIWQ